MNKRQFLDSFKIPLIVLIGIIFSLSAKFFGYPFLSMMVALFVIGLGSYDLVFDSVKSLIKGEYVLDYIAILAIVVSIITGEYLVGTIIALMISSGRTLEDYGVKSAKKALTNLVDRIPDVVLLWENGKALDKIKISKVKVGQVIFIRKGEVIPLDGVLISENGLTDESSLTGEPYEIEKVEGDQIRSGTVNIGEPIIVKVTKLSGNSTYAKIVEMVRHAQEEKAPLVRLADRYSTVFTVITLLISGFTYFYFQDLTRVLAVLVVATPCPLILATPIALIGGVNAAARKRIIIKKLAALEVLSRANTLIFDKTGTITLGMPKVENFENRSGMDEKKILGIAEAIERSSLHPLAKAVVGFAKEKGAPVFHTQKTEEILGKGISGMVDEEKYILSRLESEEGMAIELWKGNKSLAVFRFEDQIKEESRQIISLLKKMGFQMAIFTGDKEQAAKKVVEKLGEGMEVRAGLSPEDKQKGVEALKKEGKTIAMVGDGINDAPALALADVGMVFSNEEQTAASEAADVVFLGGDFEHVRDVLSISKRTIKIALQSIVWGIGVSTGAMVLASMGLIPPVAGAVLQEGIDVAVIINALRTSKG